MLMIKRGIYKGLRRNIIVSVINIVVVVIGELGMGVLKRHLRWLRVD